MRIKFKKIFRKVMIFNLAIERKKLFSYLTDANKIIFILTFIIKLTKKILLFRTNTVLASL
jgi:hypothetical protein